MYYNRIREQLETAAPQPPIVAGNSSSSPPQILPLVSVQSIYQAAAEQALRDFELDKLFNAEFYGDNGSGI